MNIAITFRHMAGTDAVKQYAHDKVAKLQKFLRQAMSAQVTLSVEGTEHIADVNISSGSQHFHAKERSQDMYASIDNVIDKLDRQIQANKGANMAKSAEARVLRSSPPKSSAKAEGETEFSRPR